MKIKTTREHFEKYAKLVETKGTNFPMPATKDEIIQAIESGDIHLNTIELSKWDGIARNYVGWTENRDGKKYSSLSQQVCFLKHLAIYHVAGAEPEFEN